MVGADTALGMDLEDFLEQVGRHQVEALTITTGRWKSERRAKKAVQRARADVIIDTRLQSAVDGAEGLADIDVARCEWLAKAARRTDAIYMLLSSARVFSGRQERPYNEQLNGDSENRTAKLLQKAEHLIRERCQRHLILRLGPVFAAHGDNLLITTLMQLQAGGVLSFAADQRICPVSSLDAARIIAGVLDQLDAGAESWGNYHYCSSDACNLYEFASVVLTCMSRFQDVETSGLTLQEKYAEQSLAFRLDCSCLRNTFGIKQVPWRGFVSDTLNRYYRNNESRSEPYS